MPVTERASSSILVAGIVAIVGGVLATLFSLAALILFSTIPVTGSIPLPAIDREETRLKSSHTSFFFYSFFFFFNDTATTEIYTLSLHDALPIWQLCFLSPH